jgi:ferredoxin, 2Fe-2S
MVRISFVEPDGRCRDIDAEEGASFKDTALAAGVKGIIGMCGGFANCGTCHVFVEQHWLDKLPAIGDAEEMMLEGTFCERQTNSRLACQIVVSKQLEGIILKTPPRQA